MGRWSAAGMVIVVLLALGTAQVVWRHLKVYLENDHQVVLCREEINRLHDLTVILLWAETLHRGHLLGLGPQYLDEYRAASAAVEARLARLAEVSGPDVEPQVTELADLIRKRMETLDQSARLATPGDDAAATRMLQATHIQELRDELRRGVVSLQAALDARLQDRIADCRRSMLSMTRWVAAGLGALLLATSGLVWSLWRENSYRRRVAADLAAARDAATAASRAKDEFLAVVGHELRTPLTPAMMLASMLERDAPAGSQQREDLSAIRRQLQLEARLIDDLLDVSHVLRGKVALQKRPVSVQPMVRDVVESLRGDAAAKHVALEHSLDAAEDRVVADESRLHQVLWHVVGNAVKFTPEGGRVSVRTSNTDGRFVAEVVDTGIGLDAKALRSLFEPFGQGDASLTRQFGGLGIGLAIAKPVVELHGGSISARSDGAGRGATFTVELPLAGAVDGNSGP